VVVGDWISLAASDSRRPGVSPTVLRRSTGWPPGHAVVVPSPGGHRFACCGRAPPNKRLYSAFAVLAARFFSCSSPLGRPWRRGSGGAALLLCASPFLAGRGGGEEGQRRAALFGISGPVCSKIAMSPLPYSLAQWLSLDLVFQGWMRWSRLHQEFFSGGMGRLAPYPPAGIHGCRAPAPQLLAVPASTRCAAPSGSAPRWWRGG
jgi:hypothetical protein